MGTLGDIWATLWNTQHQENMWANAQQWDEEKLGIQFRQNEQAAENADERARKWYNDFQSPQAIVAQLEAAGLNPALFYSGGMGGGGATVATQGGAGGGSGLTAGSNPSMGIGNPMMELADVNLKNAQARELNAEADTIEGKNKRGETEIRGLILGLDKTIAETAGTKAATIYTQAKTSLTELEAAGQALDNALKTDTYTAQVETYTATAAKAWQDINIGNEVLAREKRQNRIGDKVEGIQVDTFLATYREKMANVALIEAETGLKKAQEQLTQGEFEKLQTEVENIMWDTALKSGMTINEYLRQDNFERLLKKDYAAIEAGIQEAKINRSAKIWSSVIGLGGDVVQGAIRAAFPVTSIVQSVGKK